MARRFLAFASLVGAVVASWPLAARAQDAPTPPAPAPAAPPGPTYKNADLGVTVEGPSGWRLTEGRGAAPSWSTLATFADAVSGAQATLSARKAFALTLPKLRAEVTQLYADDKSFTVGGMTELAVSGRRPMAGLMVDATQARVPDAPAGGATPGPAATLPTVYRIQAVYLLGGDWEFLLTAQTKAPLFARLQPLIDKMFESLTLKLAGSALSERGGGSFSDDVAGFRCRFPETYSVRLPDRTQHLVEFAPATSGPIIGVFTYPTDADLDHEAQILVDFYKGPEVGGEATAGRMQIAGRDAALVTAKGRIGGRDQVFFVAVVKRGGDSFRLRVAADATQETAAKATFDAFVKSFVLTNG